MNLRRSSGVLLHPTSLPGKWGVGDLGPEACRFIDLLETGRQSIWQMLPLTPVADHGSPYSARSLFACNTLLVSPEKLVEGGFLHELPSPGTRPGNQRSVDYPEVLRFKEAVLRSAFDQSFPRVRGESTYLDFCDRNSPWLEDFALYDALTREQGGPWFQWPEEIRRRDAAALDEKRSSLREAIDRVAFAQYLFEFQWSELAAYAKSKHVKILGDVPYYVLHDSSDIWVHRDLFKVDGGGNATLVGGVPPDYFSETGQRWGNPVYYWPRLEQTGYRWWGERVRRSLEFADMVRLDHFRGYVAYWEIPASSDTAVEGRWVKVPGSLLDYIASSFPDLPFVAEDLGVITPDVVEAMARLGLPGMRVLLFAFDGAPDNPHLPSNYVAKSFAYTSTHDTNTSRGWFEDEASPGEREAAAACVGYDLTAESVAWKFIRATQGSASVVSMVSMQDLLGLGSESRMNNPAKPGGNWRWRALDPEMSEKVFAGLGEITASAGRG